MNWRDHITVDSEVLFGKPVVKDTRIPVYLILEKLAAGYSHKDLLSAYPNLTEEDIQACVNFANDVDIM